jgi:hypothetical protein
MEIQQMILKTRGKKDLDGNKCDRSASRRNQSDGHCNIILDIVDSRDNLGNKISDSHHSKKVFFKLGILQQD